MADTDSTDTPTPKGKKSSADTNRQRIIAAASVAGVVIGYLIYRSSKLMTHL